MSDVRLTATNPEDSSVVPVSCNARGELLTVAPVIEKIPNDVEIEGDLTVTGTINGDDGGSGLPEPLGPDGSILAIQDGAPAWVGKSDLCAPPPVQGDQVIWTPGTQSGSMYPAQALDSRNVPVQGITDYNAYLKDGAGWNAQPEVIDTTYGMGGSLSRGNGCAFNLQFLEPQLQVINIGVRAFMHISSSFNGDTWITASHDPNAQAQLIRSTIYGQLIANQPGSLITGSIAFLITRPNTNFDFYLTPGASYAHTGCDLTVQWWFWEETTSFLIRQQVEKDKRLSAAMRAQSEVVTTMDIDVLR